MNDDRHNCPCGSNVLITVGERCFVCRPTLVEAPEFVQIGHYGLMQTIGSEWKMVDEADDAAPVATFVSEDEAKRFWRVFEKAAQAFVASIDGERATPTGLVSNDALCEIVDCPNEGGPWGPLGAHWFCEPHLDELARASGDATPRSFGDYQLRFDKARAEGHSIAESRRIAGDATPTPTRDARTLTGRIQTYLAHTALCGVRGGYGYCTCGLDEFIAEWNRGPDSPAAATPTPTRDALTIRAIQTVNQARSDRWMAGSPGWTTLEVAGELAGEVGELANVCKKLRRSEMGVPGNKQSDAELREMAASEIADVFIVLMLTASKLGVDLEDAVRETFNRKSEQMGFPERIVSRTLPQKPSHSLRGSLLALANDPDTPDAVEAKALELVWAMDGGASRETAGDPESFARWAAGETAGPTDAEVERFWKALGRQQEWLNKPELVWPDPIWKMTVKEGFGCFDDAFWAVFQSFPFKICHVSYSGAPWSHEGGPPAMVLRFALAASRSGGHNDVVSVYTCDECGHKQAVLDTNADAASRSGGGDTLEDVQEGPRQGGTPPQFPVAESVRKVRRAILSMPSSRLATEASDAFEDLLAVDAHLVDEATDYAYAIQDEQPQAAALIARLANALSNRADIPGGDTRGDGAPDGAELQRLRAALEEWEEREASVCGEDFSFEETIHFLRTKVEGLEALLAERSEATPNTPSPAASSPVGDQTATPGTEPNPHWRCPRTRGKPCEVASLRAVDTCFASCPTVTATFGVGDQETPR